MPEVRFADASVVGDFPEILLTLFQGDYTGSLVLALNADRG